jgi:hypothetical protein
MNSTKHDTLARLAAAGLEKCMQRMTAVSSCAWQLAGTRVFTGKVRHAIRSEDMASSPAAIRVKIKGTPSFTTVLVYNSQETAHIAGCFVEGGFYSLPSVDQPEVTLIEIGNIVLNALANALLRAIGRTAIPSVPAYFKGDYGAMEAWLGAGPEDFTIISARFTMQREGRTASAEVFAFLPPALAEGTPAAQ